MDMHIDLYICFLESLQIHIKVILSSLSIQVFKLVKKKQKKLVGSMYTYVYVKVVALLRVQMFSNSNRSELRRAAS